MKSKSLLILGLCVVGLGLFIGLWERHQPTTSEAKAQAEKLFPNLKEGDLTGLELHNSHGDFHFEKAAGQWRLSSPIDAEADQAALNSLIGSLLGLKSKRHLEKGDLSLAEYGLDKPEFTLRLQTGTGSDKQLKIGSKMPLGSERALMLDEGPILLSEAYFTSSLDKALNDWRSHELCTLQLSQLAGIEIQEADSAIQALKIKDEWQLKKPVEDLADSEHLQNLLSGLTSIRILDFVDGSPDLSEMGLETPRYHLMLNPSDGSPATRLDFGALRTVDGKKQVACRRGQSEYFWVSTAAENALAKAPVLWREAQVATFNTWDVQDLEIKAGEKSASVHRDQGIWKLESGDEANASAIEERLSKLAELKAGSFDLLQIGQGEAGRIQISLRSPTEKEAKELNYVFYKAVEAENDLEVSVSGRAGLMGVSAEDVAEILENLDSLKAPEPTPEPTPGPQEGDEAQTRTSHQ